MIYVGIDVAKDKHDCCILGPDIEELFQVFTIRNNSDGYGELFHKIESVSKGEYEIFALCVLSLTLTNNRHICRSNKLTFFKCFLLIFINLFYQHTL